MNNNKVQISGNQFCILFFLIIIVDSKLQGIVMDDLRQDYLIAALIGLVLSFGIGVLHWLLSRRTKFENPGTAFGKIVGKPIGKIILVIYAIYFLFIAMQDLRDITELVRQYYITMAPLKFILIPLVVTILYGLFKGIEVIARTSGFIFISVFSAFLLFTFLILMFNRIHIDNLFPLLETDFKKILFKGFQTSYSIPFGISFIMFFIAPIVSEKQKIFKYGFIARLLGGSALIITTFVAVLIIDPNIIPTALSPSLIITRRIDAPNFIQRFDLMTLAFYVLSSVIKCSLLFYGAYSCLDGIIKIKKKTRPLVYMIFAIVVLTFANSLFSHYTYSLDFIKKYAINYIYLTLELFLPVVLLLLTFIVKPKAETEPPISVE